jgi:hypothetical protein
MRSCFREWSSKAERSKKHVNRAAAEFQQTMGHPLMKICFEETSASARSQAASPFHPTSLFPTYRVDVEYGRPVSPSRRSVSVLKP